MTTFDFKKVNRMLSERNRKSCEKFEHAIEEWIERQNYDGLLNH